MAAGCVASMVPEGVSTGRGAATSTPRLSIAALKQSSTASSPHCRYCSNASAPSLTWAYVTCFYMALSLAAALALRSAGSSTPHMHVGRGCPLCTMSRARILAMGGLQSGFYGFAWHLCNGWDRADSVLPTNVHNGQGQTGSFSPAALTTSKSTDLDTLALD